MFAKVPPDCTNIAAEIKLICRDVDQTVNVTIQPYDKMTNAKNCNHGEYEV